jgi:broad specificity phosphatase PhoE
MAILLLVAGFVAVSAQAQIGKTVILVRHAEKTATPPNDPVLSEKGDERAQKLAQMLIDTRIDHIITSQSARTILTAQYVAEAGGLSPEIVAVGSELRAHIQAVADAVHARPDGEAILVVGHSNTIPSIVGALGGSTLPDLKDENYSTVYILMIEQGMHTRTIVTHWIE